MHTPVGELTRRYNAARIAKEPLRKQWLLNIAFYLNRQWTVYDRSAGMVRDAYLKYPRMRYSSNLVRSRVWIPYAKITRHDPSFHVSANSIDEVDVAKAKGAATMLWYFWQTNGYRRVFAEALLWAALTGTGFVKVIFDPDGGDGVEVGGEVYKTGTVLIDSYSPLEVFPDPFARSVEELSWVIFERVRPVEYVQKKWGVKPPADDSAETITFSEPRMRLLKQGTADTPSCRVREYWERPSEEKPEGEYAVWVGNHVLHSGPNPYASVGVPLPVTGIVYLPIPGLLWGDSPVTDLRQVNVMYNMIRSDILENLTKVSNPLLTAPIGALQRPPQFEPGELIEFNPLAPQGLTPIQIEPYPPHALNMLMRLLQEADDLTGVTEVSRGQVPRGIRAAESLAYLLEQEESRLSLILEEYENAIATAMTYALRLARAFIPLPLVLRVLGENRTYEATLFKTEDIPPNADVIVDQGSTLHRSGTALQQLVFNLWDRGIIRDPSLVLRLSRYGALEEAAGDAELDVAQAQRENQKLREGQAVEVEDFHNHLIHIMEHDRYRKSAEYEEAGADVKQAFRVHVEAHMGFASRQIQSMQGGENVAAGRGAPRPDAR